MHIRECICSILLLITIKCISNTFICHFLIKNVKCSFIFVFGDIDMNHYLTDAFNNFSKKKCDISNLWEWLCYYFYNNPTMVCKVSGVSLL